MDWLAVSVRFFTGIYVSRAPFSLERMSFNKHPDTVLYRGEHFHPTLARNFEVTNPLAWIVRITSHIPRKGWVPNRSYTMVPTARHGEAVNAGRGILPNAKIDKEPDSSTQGLTSCSKRRRQQWAVLLKKVWDEWTASGTANGVV